MNKDYTDIPLPQDTKLYEVVGDTIAEPKLAVETIGSACTVTSASNTGYADLSGKKFLFQVYNQNVSEIYVRVNDKNVSCFAPGTSYYSLNGYDHGFDHRFINLDSPTVCFLPKIAATDDDKNINIASGYISTTNLITSNVAVNDYILLTNQDTASENKPYRVIGKEGTTLQIASDSTIDSVLSQDENYIFTRAMVETSSGTYYYGLSNSLSYRWISQTKGIQLPSSNYGITLYSELTTNRIAVSYFNDNNIVPKIGETIAINIVGSGKTTGIYQITRLMGGYAYFAPMYPSYIFIHQFTKVETDLNTMAPAIWMVDPQYIHNTAYLYSARQFAFRSYNASSIISDPSLWARQIGGTNDTIIGFSIFTNDKHNNYIKHSDTFAFTTKVPRWADNGGILKGLSLTASYSTNMMDIEQQEVVI